MGKGGAVGLWGLMDDSLKVRLAGTRGVARIPSLRDGPQGSVYIRLLPGHVTRVVGLSSRVVAGLFQCVSDGGAVARIQGGEKVDIPASYGLVMKKPSLGAILKRAVSAKAALRVWRLEHGNRLAWRASPTVFLDLIGRRYVGQTVGSGYLGLSPMRAVHSQTPWRYM